MSDLQEVIAGWRILAEEFAPPERSDLTRILDAAEAGARARDALRLIDKIATEHRRGAAVEMQAVARRALRGAA